MPKLIHSMQFENTLFYSEFIHPTEIRFLTMDVLGITKKIYM